MSDEITHWYWCTVGFTPEDVANGKCRKYNKNSFGCSRCRDFKLVPTEEIIQSSKKRF